MKHSRTHRRRHRSKTSRRHLHRRTRKGGAHFVRRQRASMSISKIRQDFQALKNRYPIPKPAGHSQPINSELSELKQLRDEADYVAYDANIAGNASLKNSAKSLGDEIEVYEMGIFREYK